MIIGIDGNEANVERHVGSSTYTLNLLERFQKLASGEHSFKIFLRAQPNARMPAETDHFKYVVIPGPFAWSQFWLPLYLNAKRNIDIFFAPAHYSPRACPVPVVVTIHDLAYFYYPEEFLKKDLYKLKTWTYYSVTNAKKIIAVSKTTKKDLLKWYQLPEQAIEVIYNGYEKKTAPVKTKESLDTWKLTKNKYILYVGTLQPRKNIPLLMQAFEKLTQKHPDFHLVITGKKGWMYDSIQKAAAELPSHDKIIFTDYVDDSTLATLYQNAFCFVLPSLYEGFGIPVLEAMSYGCPVLASHASSLPEVGGEACLYFDPTSAQDLHDRIQYLIDTPEVRTDLIKKGRAHVTQFSWDTCAQQTLDVFGTLSL